MLHCVLLLTLFCSCVLASPTQGSNDQEDRQAPCSDSASQNHLIQGMTAMILNLQERVTTLEQERQSSGRFVCPADYQYDSGINFCYKLELEAKNWSDATFACESRGPGFHLATLDSRAKYELALQLLKDSASNGQPLSTYVGLLQEQEEGNWFWSHTGEQLADPRLWAEGEPGVPGGQNFNEDCAMLIKTGLCDIMCHTVRPSYLCERDLD